MSIKKDMMKLYRQWQAWEQPVVGRHHATSQDAKALSVEAQLQACRMLAINDLLRNEFFSPGFDAEESALLIRALGKHH
jgi:hypothetical protein